MDWIKKNSTQLMLATFALALLAMTAMLIMNAEGFDDTFAAIRGEVRKNNTIPPLDLAPIEEAKAKVQQPSAWTVKPEAGSLFVANKYVIQDGRPVDPLRGD